MNVKYYDLERNRIGSAIQYFREKYNISQSTLCRGLCSVTTLSRIESGEREADGLLLETLLERMGKTPNKFELVLTEVDYVSYQKRKELENCIEKREYKAASELLRAYKKLIGTKGNLHKQFIVRTEAHLNELQGGSLEKTIELLTEAILYTVPGFETNEMKDYYLSNIELDIILDIAGRMLLIGMSDRAKEILLQAMEFLDFHDTLELVDSIYPKFAVIACTVSIAEREYENALAICNKGLEKVKSSRKLDYRGELALIQAQINETLIKRKDDWTRQQDEFLKWYLQAYHVFNLINEKEKAQQIRGYIQEEYPWVNID